MVQQRGKWEAISKHTGSTGAFRAFARISLVEAGLASVTFVADFDCFLAIRVSLGKDEKKNWRENPKFTGKVRSLGQVAHPVHGTFGPPVSVGPLQYLAAMEDNQFDVIILGTGLVESITAA